MLANNKIRCKTDMIGFLVMTINIPDKIETQDIIYKKKTLKPENVLNVSNNTWYIN